MKIGILTFHRSHNYGAFMQSYALVMALREAGYEDVEIVDFNMKKSERYYKKEIINKRTIWEIRHAWKRYKMFKEALRTLPLSEESFVSDSISDFAKYLNKKYDVVITGSDEVWRLDGLRGFPNPYWLPEIKDCYKMAYAVSARNYVEEVSNKQYELIRNLVADFDFISVRDNVTKELIEYAVKGKQDIVRVCDPTMAYTFKYDNNEGKKLLRELFGVNTTKKCIGIMSSNPQIAQTAMRKCEGKVQVISLFNHCKGAKNYASLTPFQWYQIIAVLDGLVTTYFHGMCFAINGNTPFVLLENRKIRDNKYSKSYDLLSRYGLECLYVQINNEDNIEGKLGSYIEDMINGDARSNFDEVKIAEQHTFTYLLQSLASLENRS